MRKEEQSLEDNIKLELSPAAKKEYLKKLSGRIVKILYLIEGETEETAGSAESYILGQIFELNASNVLFDNALIDVIIKLNSILQYKTLEFAQVRKQVLEAKSIVDHMVKKL